MSAPVALEPPSNRRMTFESFNKDAFRLDVDVVAARVPTMQVGKFKKDLARSILAIPRVTSVAADSQTTQSKLLLLDKAKKDELPSEVLDIIAQSEIQLVPHRVTLGYDYWNASQILRAILPEELLDDLPASFTVVGHIAHFNLRDEYLPYKDLIGQVVLDKNPAIETVVNKLDSIDNEYRFFEMEVLAGKPDFKVTTSENGCQFRFDFSKVYWNSRLQTEHTRLVDSFDEKDVIADGFAGVGPFAIPAAAKKGCLGVMANDLNPMSAEGLRENVQLNKVEDDVRCYNMDGKDFFRQAVQELYRRPFPARSGPRMSANKAAKLARHEREQRKKAGGGNESSQTQNGVDSSSSAHQQTTSSLPGRFVDHFVLNLPATAITFLDAFQGIYTPLVTAGEEERKAFLGHLVEYSEWRGHSQEKASHYRLPMVHCYCFTKEVDAPEPDINQRATASLGYPVSSDTLSDYNLSLVRSVAPAKDMYRLSFRLPEEVVFVGVPKHQHSLQ